MPENNYQSVNDLNKVENQDRVTNLKTQKRAVIFLAALGVFFVGFGFYQFKNRINKPFDFGADKTSSNQAEMEQQYLSVLQNRDTDNDKLSDYDEINVYGTSAYLEDSDSDGLNDYMEISQGTDPVCPEGENCLAGSNNLVSTSTELTTASTTNSSSDPSLTLGTEEKAILEGIVAGQADSKTLRDLLLANGLSQEELDGISDEDLQAAYQKASQESLDSQAN